MDFHPDAERVARNRQGMRQRRVDAIVCARPSSVLLLSGFWSVIGDTLAIATPDATHLLTPTDSADLARNSWADSIHQYELGSLDRLEGMTQAVQPALKKLLRSLNLDGARIGYEGGPSMQTSPYAAMSDFGCAFLDLLRSGATRAGFIAVDDLLEELRLIKTPLEISKIKSACGVAGQAFAVARDNVRTGKSEMDVAAPMRGALMHPPQSGDRCDGFAFCMSGPNAAEAYKFFQLTRQRKLTPGDTVLVHCNSHANGYWTDITRTFFLGDLNKPVGGMYDAIFAARQAGLDAIRPGVSAKEVDHAARTVMEARGFGKEFRHPLGHGVGFAAIDHNAKPRLHPTSPDILREGMVFNVEPGIYFENQCGMRHCDVVACRSGGAEVLTDFQGEIAQLVV